MLQKNEPYPVSPVNKTLITQWSRISKSQVLEFLNITFFQLLITSLFCNFYINDFWYNYLFLRVLQPVKINDSTLRTPCIVFTKNKNPTRLTIEGVLKVESFILTGCRTCKNKYLYQKSFI